MPLRILRGRGAVGKTAWINAAIERLQREKKTCLLLVPEASSYEAEMALMDRMQGHLLGVQVLSMARFAQRILNEAGGRIRFFLSADGKRMVIRKLLEERQGELPLLGHEGVRSGLSAQLDRMIAQLKGAQIAPATLRMSADALRDPFLAQKLNDIATVYEGLEAFMEGRYIDAEDRQALLIARMEEAQTLRETEVFIDGFAGRQYNAQAFAIIGKLIEICPRVTVSLRLGEASDPDDAIFAPERRALVKLLDLARSQGLDDRDIEQIRLDSSAANLPDADSQGVCSLNWEGSGGSPPTTPKALAFLEQNLYAYTSSVGPEDPSLRHLRAPNRREEVAAVAAAIDELLRGGAKCREIGIAVGDIDAYAPLLRRALGHLPIFLDEGRKLASHGVVELTMGALSACESGFRTADLLRVAKSGFLPIDDGALDEFESYVLKNGIRFVDEKRAFEREDDADPTLRTRADATRLALMPPLVRLRERSRQATDAQSRCEALFRFYEDIGLRERLRVFCEAWVERGEHDIALENAQVWNAVLALLDQIALLLEGKMSAKRFAAVLEEGFAAHEIGMIPPSADQIAIAPVKRMSMRSQLAHVFVLGCNEGLLPAAISDDGLIDDGDIEALEGLGIDAFEHSTRSSAAEKQCVYALLAHPRRSLFVSWAVSDESGLALSPSMTAERVAQLFPHNCNRASLASPRPDRQGSPAAAFSKTIVGLRALADCGDPPDALDAAVSYFQGHPRWTGRLGACEARLFGSPPGMRAADVSPVYGAMKKESPSRLETFNQCPFKHFIRYGLRPDEKRVHTEEASDVGSFYHEALDRFTRRMIDEGRDWATLTEAECAALIDAILSEIESAHNKGVLLESARGRAQLARMRATLLQSAWAMTRQIAAGDFRPIASEAIVGVDLPPIRLVLSDGREVELIGKIDRVDRFEGKGAAYIRIVDYKSGSQSFSFSELYHGVKLQLPLYLKAASQIGHAGGMFYLHLAERDVDRAALADPESAEHALQIQYKLQGVLLVEDDIPRAMDRLSETHSDIIPVRFTKTGASGKETLLPAGQMNIALDVAQDIAAQTAERILAGETDAKPVKQKSATACDYCDYQGVCRFESKSGGGYRKIDSLNAEAFFARAQGQTQDTVSRETFDGEVKDV